MLLVHLRKGYLMIISKELISSYALLEEKKLKEFYWLIQQVKNQNKKYNKIQFFI